MKWIGGKPGFSGLILGIKKKCNGGTGSDQGGIEKIEWKEKNEAQ